MLQRTFYPAPWKWKTKKHNNDNLIPANMIMTKKPKSKRCTIFIFRPLQRHLGCSEVRWIISNELDNINLLVSMGVKGRWTCNKKNALFFFSAAFLLLMHIKKTHRTCIRSSYESDSFRHISSNKLQLQMNWRIDKRRRPFFLYVSFLFLSLIFYTADRNQLPNSRGQFQSWITNKLNRKSGKILVPGPWIGGFPFPFPLNHLLPPSPRFKI